MSVRRIFTSAYSLLRANLDRNFAISAKSSREMSWNSKSLTRGSSGWLLWDFVGLQSIGNGGGVLVGAALALRPLVRKAQTMVARRCACRLRAALMNLRPEKTLFFSKC
jgi:hypothetical protein